MATMHDALRNAESLSPAELDHLPFGMIQLDAAGMILKYNQAEATLARLEATKQVGRSFFDDVAPCTKVKEFYGRFTEGVRRKELYETFGYTFRFPDRTEQVAVTLMYSAATNTVWVMISRQAGGAL